MAASVTTPSAAATTSRPLHVPSLPTVAPSASASSTALQDGDGDVDMGGDQSDNEGETGNYGYQGPQTAVTRDAESDDIVWQLERGLPRWPGYSEKGWYEDQNLVRMSREFFLARL